jgi:DNA-binding response OmpR family regulator
MKNFGLKVLVVDDEPAICQILVDTLSDNYSVTTAQDGEAALAIAVREKPDLILLDYDMPIKNGSWFCEQYRKTKLGKDTPIFIVSACADPEKRMGLYQTGADDFIEKPFKLNELCAKVDARLRRVRDFKPNKTVLGNMTFDRELNTLDFGTSVVHLSKIEAKILSLFVQSLNVNLSRQKIIDTLWPNTTVEEKTINVHMVALRRKIKDLDHEIRTVHGLGYVMVPKPQPSHLNA